MYKFQFRKYRQIVSCLKTGLKQFEETTLEHVELKN